MYVLLVKDGNGTVRQENDLIAQSGGAPEMPAALKAADLSEDVRTVYFAAWVAHQANEWTFEAMQSVGKLCDSVVGREWLSDLGDVPEGCEKVGK